jgi:small-conductance mechanosensitive channel
MKINFFNLGLVFGCCVVPYAVLVTLLISRSIRARSRYRHRLLRRLEDNSDGEAIHSNTRWVALSYLMISLLTLSGLICIMVLVIAYYLDIPVLNNIDHQTIGTVVITALLISVLLGIILAIISRKLFKVKD